MIQTRQVRGSDPALLFTVTEETLSPGRKRTLSIEGPIRQHKGPRTSTRGVEDRTAFDHRGHLIAHRFGGPGSPTSGNLVAMHGLINMSGKPWAEMEATIAEFLGSRQAFMRVAVQYKGDATRPHAFQVEVRYSNGMLSHWKTFNFNPHATRS